MLMHFCGCPTRIPSLSPLVQPQPSPRTMTGMLPQAMPTIGQGYVLQNKATGFYCSLDDPEVHRVYTSASRSRGQAWVLETADIGYRLRSVDTRRMLDSNAAQEVYTMPSNDGAYQKWRMYPDEEGYWSLI